VWRWSPEFSGNWTRLRAGAGGRRSAGRAGRAHEAKLADVAKEIEAKGGQAATFRHGREQ